MEAGVKTQRPYHAQKAIADYLSLDGHLVHRFVARELLVVTVYFVKTIQSRCGRNEAERRREHPAFWSQLVGYEIDTTK